MLNPQPLPPGGVVGDENGGRTALNGPGRDGLGQGGARTESAGGGVLNRGLLGAIIVVCLIGLVGGGVALVPQFFASAGSQLKPGVYAWAGLGGDPGGGAGDASRKADLTTFCKKISSSKNNDKESAKSSSLEEHLIAGGFDLQSGAGPSVAVPDNSTSQWGWRLYRAGGKWTSYAICLREPQAFFAPAHALDYITGAGEHFASDAPTVTSEASCPSGENILGGGYYALGGGTAGGQDVTTSLSVSSSYPIVDGSGARWHVSVAQSSHSSSATLAAFAICSGTMQTHLEHTGVTVKAVPSSASHPPFVGSGAASCASGTLLSGGFHVTQGSDDSGLESDVGTNAPGKTLKGDKIAGATFSDWAVTVGGSSTLLKDVTGETWIVCWGANAQPQPTATSATPASATASTTLPTPTTAAVPTATPVGVAQPTPTDTPAAQPTPTPQPTPTNTPTPQCQIVAQGSASNVNVDLSDINLDSSGPATLPNATSHIRYSQVPGGSIFSPVNGSALHDVGEGADFGALDCASLRSFGYGGGTAPYAVGEVFAVQTPGGHYAKVQIVAGPTGAPQVQWVTYSVS
jgi:hypothetical protein